MNGWKDGWMSTLPLPVYGDTKLQVVPIPGTGISIKTVITRSTNIGIGSDA